MANNDTLDALSDRHRLGLSLFLSQRRLRFVLWQIPLKLFDDRFIFL